MSNIDRYECSPESDDPSDRYMALFGEMLGTTFSRGIECDPVTGIKTEWTYRGDGLYCAREDIDASREAMRLMRDYQEYGSRDNTITEKRGNDIVSIAYHEGNSAVDGSDRFDFKIKAERNGKEVGFIASYLPDGTVRSFDIMTLKDEEPAIEEVSSSLPEEKQLDTKLSEVINLYRLKGKAAFDLVLRDNLTGGIDLGGSIPRFILSDALLAQGYTNDDVEAITALASFPVEYHFDYTNALDDVSIKDKGLVFEFLKTITAASLIPAFVHKDNRNLFPKYEDINVSTPEGIQLMLRYYNLALTQFIQSYNRHVVSAGVHSAAFSPYPEEQGAYVFTIQKSGPHGREILHEDILTHGQEVRYGRSVYAVYEADDHYSLSVRDIFSMNKDDSAYIITAPLTLNTTALRHAMDAEDSSWRESFSHVPIHFQIT